MTDQQTAIDPIERYQGEPVKPIPAPFTTPLTPAGQLHQAKACTSCHGTGRSVHEAFTGLEGTAFPRRVYRCASCDGLAYFSPATPEQALEIGLLITSTRGKNKGTLRASFGSKEQSKASTKAIGNRAYYVWRLARFHGGVDGTLPMTAGTSVYGDPFRADLDAMSEAVAKAAFGSDMRGAARWARALGGY